MYMYVYKTGTRVGFNSFCHGFVSDKQIRYGSGHVKKLITTRFLKPEENLWIHQAHRKSNYKTALQINET
jgi:hypothetical protein